jgi:hypothetical protein
MIPAAGAGMEERAMSERPDADVNVKSIPGVKTTVPPTTTPATAAPPMTQEKPGTGKPDGPTLEPNKGFSGSAEYPDGYRMSWDERGNVHLTDPDGQVAIWNPTVLSWVDETTGNLMPPDWGSDHYPDTQKGGPHAHSGQ